MKDSLTTTCSFFPTGQQVLDILLSEAALVYSVQTFIIIIIITTTLVITHQSAPRLFPQSQSQSPATAVST